MPLTKDQQALMRYMSGISEDCYWAGWLLGLEYTLWKAVLEGPMPFGPGRVTEGNILDLKNLAKACGGWIYWDNDTDEETFIPIDQWKAMYDKHITESWKIIEDKRNNP
jgi:hypothetical protein